MPDIKAFVSDLDDTLLTEDHQMTDRTCATLQRLLRQGVKVVLASGRSAASMRPVVRRVGTPYPYIAFNGAQIVDAKTHQVIAGNEIDLPLAREMLRWLEARGVYAQYYQGDDWFHEAESQIAMDYAHSTGVPGTVAGEKLSGHIRQRTPKILAVDTKERVAALIPEAREAFPEVLSITTSKPYFMEITSPRATKGFALAALAERIGLSPATTVCAGDSLNDLSMLTWSSLPVTVENARDEVKAVAVKIAGDGRHDGMAALLDEWIPDA